MIASNLRPESATSPQHSQAHDGKSGVLNISQQVLQSFLYGREKVELVDQNERKRKAANTDGVSLSGESLPSKRRPSVDSHDVQPTYAVRSFPAEVQLCTSSIPGVEYGVCAKQHIPSGTWIGPFEGNRLQPSDLTSDVNTDYIWEVYENGRLSHYLDGNDENSSSWMRFIRCARHAGEQNMYAFQFCGSVFYRAFRDISIGTEMLVWYDVHYPQFMGIPLGLKDIQLISSLGAAGMQNGFQRQNALAVPVPSSCPTDAKDEDAVHQPRFSPVQILTEDADGSVSINQPSKHVIPDDHLNTMQHASQAELTIHHQQQRQQQHQQRPQRHQKYQQHHHTQYHYELNHLPNQHQQNQQNNHPNNFQQHQLQPRQHIDQQVYNRHQLYQLQQEQQQQQQQQQQQRLHQYQHHHRHQHHQQHPQHLPQQHQHQYKHQQQNQQRQQHGQYRPASSFFGRDSANHIDRKSPGSTAPPTVPPLRSISQHIQNQQHTSFWTNNRSPRNPGPYQGETRLMRPPNSRSAVANTNPRAVPSSSPNQTLRTVLSIPSHPLKSAHVKPFHINTSSLVETTTKESGDESLNRGQQDGCAVESGEKKVHARQENAPINETKWKVENDEVDIIKIDDETPTDLSMSKCKQCQKTFNHGVSLSMHVCSRKPKKPFQCGHCPLSFSTPSELRDHVETHGSEKSFKCGFCARCFAGPTTLNNHMRTHTGEKPFSCRQCGKNFTQATHLARHQHQGKCTD